jgi:Tfp pilus assembly protein PilF
LKIKPDVMTFDNLGSVLLKIGKYDEALETFQQALSMAPNDPKLRNNIGIALMKKGRLEEAAVQLQEAVRLKPDYSVAIENVKEVKRLMAGGQPVGVISAITLKSGSLAHCQRGDQFLSEGNASEAESEFRQALLLDADNVESMNSLAVLLFLRGEKDAAVAMLRRSLQIDPANARGHFNLGHALLRTGRFEESIVQLRESLRLDSKAKQARADLNEAVLKLKASPSTPSAHGIHR